MDKITIFMFLSIIINITVHEFMHAWAALKMGDNTAARLGRLTLNPVAHFDIMGMFSLIITQGSFGWGKPVPVNPTRFRHLRRGEFIVSAAGPLSNFSICLISVCTFYVIGFIFTNMITPSAQIENILKTLKGFLIINSLIATSLGFFNLLPIFPLDGSHIFKSLAPQRWALHIQNIERYSGMVLIALIVLEVGFKVPLVLTMMSRGVHSIVFWLYAIPAQ